ncbi:MAG: HisA/HisF-related TIM barrel protein [Planctomycetaceae bacterium]
MQILPVLDLMNGVVVRGAAGRRETYRPIESRIAPTAEPLAVARAFRDRLGLTAFYVADLDAIVARRPQRDICRMLRDEGFTLLIDAGVRSLADADAAFDNGAAAVIAGLETLPSPSVLRDLCERFEAERILFSLDLSNGRPLRRGDGWADDPFAIARPAIEAGVRRMIVLDLSAVGVGAGVPTGELCQRLRESAPGESAPGLELITGGGVRSVEDLQALQSLGIDGVLIASALHDGRIGRKEIEAVGRTS